MGRKKKYEEPVEEEEEELEEEETEWAPNMVRMFGGDVPPSGCRACGGPYPSCKISCSMFDD